MEAVEGSSWLSHRGTGTRVALNVTSNSQWKEVNCHDDDDNDDDDDCIGGEKYTIVIYQKVKVEKKSGLRLLFFDLPLLKPS